MFTISVIIPTFKQSYELTETEKISLWQTTKIFQNYDIFLATHSGINTESYQDITCNSKPLRVHLFKSSFFKSIAGYNQLMLSLKFYKAFKEYKYILICQLDAFMFENKLSYFTGLDVDYIGAPWFDGYDKASSTSQIIGVGNGGFSLRKTKSFITILELIRLYQKPYKTLFSGLWAALRNPITVLLNKRAIYFSKTEFFGCVLEEPNQAFISTVGRREVV